MKKSRVTLGILILLAAVAFLLEKLNLLSFTIFKDIGVFKLILALLLVLCIIRVTIQKHFSDIPLPLAFLCIIFSKHLGLEAITPWPVIIIAVLVTFALALILPEQQPLLSYVRTSPGTMGSSNLEGEDVRFDTVLGSAVKYVISDSLEKVDLKVILGDMDIFLDKAKLKSDILNINISQTFGDITLYIPKDWKLENSLHSFIGDFRDDGPATSETTAAVILSGRKLLGDLTVTRV